MQLTIQNVWAFTLRNGFIDLEDADGNKSTVYGTDLAFEARLAKAVRFFAPTVRLEKSQWFTPEEFAELLDRA